MTRTPRPLHMPRFGTLWGANQSTHVSFAKNSVCQSCTDPDTSLRSWWFSFQPADCFVQWAHAHAYLWVIQQNNSGHIRLLPNFVQWIFNTWHSLTSTIDYQPIKILDFNFSLIPMTCTLKPLHVPESKPDVPLLVMSRFTLSGAIRNKYDWFTVFEGQAAVA